MVAHACEILFKNSSKNTLICENRELKHVPFLDEDGNRKWAVFPFDLSSHNHIYIAKYKGKGKGKVTLFNVGSSFRYEAGISGSRRCAL